MTPFKVSLCLLGLLLAGCASEPLRRFDALNASPAPLQTSASAAQRSLDAAPSCCASLRDLPFVRIGADFSGEVLIDENAPAFEFDSGKSFFRAFQLPADSKSFEIRLYSQAGDTVLAPHAMLLDSQYRVTRLLGPDDFVYAPAAGLKSDSLDARLRVDRLYQNNPGNEHYLVLYSSAKQMSGQTVIEHPAKAYARALGNQPPNIPDPVVKHAPVGMLKMVLIEDKIAGQVANTYVPPYSVGQAMGNTVPSVPPPAVLPETQAYYRQGIDAALASQDLSRALRLADEAERVGDASAKAYLLERIQIK